MFNLKEKLPFLAKKDEPSPESTAPAKLPSLNKKLLEKALSDSKETQLPPNPDADAPSVPKSLPKLQLKKKPEPAPFGPEKMPELQAFPPAKQDYGLPPDELFVRQVREFERNTTLSDDISASESSESSFFDNLLEHIKKEKDLLERRGHTPRDSIQARDLLNEMKAFWNQHKASMLSDAHSKAVEESIQEKVRELKQLELDWQSLETTVEKTQRLLSGKESEIDAKISELKGSLQKYKFKVNVDPNKFFFARNGAIIRNLYELLEAVRIMSDEDFFHHVSESKNDFAVWVSDAVGDKEIARAIRDKKSKKDFIEALKTFKLS